ncbi:MAG TPA: hypothetical protein PKW90_11010, partial [Myxococcota bacterium]|nr:hypothetical protein [Myxococcota bacterium]
LVNSADSFVVNRDYDSATKELKLAETVLGSAKTTIDHYQRLERRKNSADPKIQQVDTKPNVAFAAFKKVYDEFSPKIDGTFSGDLGTAYTKAEQGRDQPNVTLLEEALDDVQGIYVLSDLLASYNRVKTRLANRISTLKGKARNGVFADDYNTIDQQMDQAQDHADNRRYSDAMACLTTAAGLVSTAELETGKWDWYQDNRQTVQDKINEVDTDEGRAAMDVEVQKVKDDLLEADKLRDQKKGVDGQKALRKVYDDTGRLVGWLTLYKKARKAEKEKITDRIAQIQNKPLVAKDLEEVEKLKLQLAKMFTDRQFAEAVEMATYTIAWRMDLAISELARFDAYEVEQKKAETALDDLKKVSCDANKLEIRALEVDYKAAEAQATARNFAPATDKMAGIPARCVAPTQQGSDATAAEASRKTASEAIDALIKDFPGLLELELDLQKSRLAIAAELVAKADFVGAKKVTDGIATAAIELRKQGSAQATLEQDSKDLAGKSGPDGLNEDIEKVRLSAQKLQGRADDFLKNHQSQIDRLLKTATSEAQAGKVEPARTALNEAAAAVAHANELVEEYLRSEAVIQESADEILRLKGLYTVPPRLVESLDRLDKELGFARKDSADALATTAIRISLSVQAELRALATLGAQHALYVDQRSKVDPRVAKLATSKARYSVAKTLGEIRAYLAEADISVKAGDYAGAKGLVNSAVELLDTSELTVAMNENEEVK